MDNVRILGHKAVRTALRDTDTYSSDLQGDSDVRDYRQIPLEVDPPRHHAYRSALSPLFVRPKIQELEPEFEKIAKEVIAQFETTSGGDFVAEVALSFIVSCLGVIYNRPQDVNEWYSWGPDVWTAESNGRSGTKLHDYLEQMYEQARNSTTEDVWTFVYGLDLDGAALSFTEFKGIGSVLLAGGRDTVVKLMSGTVWHLIKTRSDVEAILNQEVPLESAIQEMLRVFTPLPAMLRVPPEQQKLSDTQRDPSKFVAIDFASANYDPEIFPEPAKIDIRRERIAHVSFGFGPHTCIGNHIAEIETKVLFKQLLPKLKNWSLSAEPEINWQKIGQNDFPDRFEKIFINTN